MTRNLCKLTVANMCYRQVCLFSLLAVLQFVSGEIGHAARPGEYPHQVSLQVGFGSIDLPEIIYIHTCGGTILNEKWILTTARCLEQYENTRKSSYMSSIDSFIVKAGKYRLDQYESTEQNSTEKEFFKHPKYADDSRALGPIYDIGLIKLNSPLKLNSHVAAAELPMAGNELTGECVSSGWNAAFTSDTQVMQEVKLSTIDYISCNKIYEKMNRKFARKQGKIIKKLVLESNVCAEPLDSDGPNDCIYDIGSALIKKKDGKAEVVGILSWSPYSCSRDLYPTVYVKVSSFVDWITKTIAANS